MPSRHVGFRFFNVARRYTPPRRVGSCTNANGDDNRAAANDHDNEDISSQPLPLSTRTGGLDTATTRGQAYMIHLHFILFLFYLNFAYNRRCCPLGTFRHNGRGLPPSLVCQCTNKEGSPPHPLSNATGNPTSIADVFSCSMPCTSHINDERRAGVQGTLIFSYYYYYIY